MEWHDNWDNSFWKEKIKIWVTCEHWWTGISAMSYFLSRCELEREWATSNFRSIFSPSENSGKHRILWHTAIVSMKAKKAKNIMCNPWHFSKLKPVAIVYIWIKISQESYGIQGYVSWALKLLQLFSAQILVQRGAWIPGHSITHFSVHLYVQLPIKTYTKSKYPHNLFVHE